MKREFIKYTLPLITVLFFIAMNAEAQMYWNTACSFEGTSSSYISRGNSASLNITGSFTLEAWVKPVDVYSPSVQTLIQKREGGNANGYTLYLTNGKPAVRINETTRLIGKTSIQNNAWSHVSVSYSSSSNNYSITINGGTDTNAVVPGSAPVASTDSLFIGKGFNGPFQGQMDEVRIWNKVMSNVTRYRYSKTSLGTNSGLYEGLVLSLTFQDNEGSGTPFSLIDWSGTGNNCSNRGVTAVDLSNRPLDILTINDCVELDAFLDYIAAPDQSALSPSGVFTFDAWIYPRVLSANNIIIHKGSPDGTSADYSIRLHNGYLKALVNNITVLASDDFIPPNRWTHVAFTYDAAEGNNIFYINGKISDVNNNNNANVNNSNDSFYVGGAPELAGFNGFIDELRIKLAVKSEDEINRFMFESIDEANDLPGTELVYNFDGYLTSSTGGSSRLYFRNDARFSHSGIDAGKPVSPLLRNDNLNFGGGYYKKSSDRRIPAAGTSGESIEDTLDIFLNETINDLNLFVALNHTREQNLVITLIAPNGEEVDLYNSYYLSENSEGLETIFDDQADSSIVNGRFISLAPAIKPHQNINSVFSGDNTFGKWRLIVNDLSVNDTGRLYGWGIQFNNENSIPKLLSANFFIQGFYNAQTNLTVQDTVRLFAREIESPYQIADSSKGVLHSNGNITASFSKVQSAHFYYIQINHRNSIETWSSIPFAFEPLTAQGQYNFSNSPVYTFGSNVSLIDNWPVRFGIFSGDVNQDDFVDLTDNQLIDNAMNNYVFGYVNTDLNGDNTVDLSDAAIADNNAFNFVSSIKP